MSSQSNAQPSKGEVLSLPKGEPAPADPQVAALAEVLAALSGPQRAAQRPTTD